MSEDAAYAAATKRPPNMPLTREQVMALDDLDAVWIFNPWETDPECVVVMGEALFLKETKDIAPVWKCILFARNPTHADIEAARSTQK